MRQSIALLIVSALTLVGFASAEPFTEVYVPNKIILSEPTELEKFLKHMANRESNNTPHIVNPYGMMGKYQFSPNTVRVLGYNISKEEFLHNTVLQDSVMITYLRANNRELNTYISRYENRVYKGVKITRSGVLAAAHLCGSGNIKRFFVETDYDGCKDANNTSAREYMQTFSIYTLIEI
jgi:hypothetical protein